MRYDLIIIGSGPAGYVAAVRSAQLGFKTAIIEKALLGGVCLNWGCIPTKALLKSVEALNTARNAENYGVKIAGSVEPDIKAIVERSRQVAAQMTKGIEFLLNKYKIDVIHGRGTVQAPGKVRVGDQVLEGKNILIATG